MSQQIVGYIPRLLFRIYLYLKIKFDNKLPLTERERYCIQITNRLIKKPDTKLLFTPGTHKRVISNDLSNIMIKIEGRTLELINLEPNNRFVINVFIDDDKELNSIVKKFDEEIEKRFEEYNISMTTSINNFLKKASEEIGYLKDDSN